MATAMGDNMTRAEAAQMFYNLLRQKNVTVTVQFSDVSDDAWYATAVNTLASLGILKGVGEDKYDPTRAISRAEFAAIATRFAKVNLEGLQNPLRRTGSAQIVKALPDGIVCASSNSKAVGVRVCQLIIVT